MGYSGDDQQSLQETADNRSYPGSYAASPALVGSSSPAMSQRGASVETEQGNSYQYGSLGYNSVATTAAAYGYGTAEAPLPPIYAYQK
jgi:hypothetical protein